MSVKSAGLQVGRYFRDDVILGSGYPWDLMFAHCVKSAATWRAFCELHDEKSFAGRARVYDFVCAFLCHGFGGTHVRDWAMGQTPGSFSNPQVGKAWVLAFALVYYAPLDVVYSLVGTPRTLSSLILTAFEAVDSATTLCGSVEKARKLFPLSPHAPLLAGMLAGVGGSLFRYAERRLGRGWEDEETEWARPAETIKRTLLYTVAYMVLSRSSGVRKARLWVTCFHIALCLAREATGST